MRRDEGSEAARLGRGLRAAFAPEREAYVARARLRELPPARRRLWLVLLAPVAVAAVAVAVWRPVTWQATGPGTHGGLSFSDGTTVALAPGAATHVESAGRTGARVALDRGAARFRVHKRPLARWSVRAGRASIEVTGTAFDVRFDPDTHALAVAVFEGAVRVRGVGPDPVAVAAGHVLVADARGTRTVAFGGGAAFALPAEPQPVPELDVTPQLAPAPTPAAPPPSSERARAARPQTHNTDRPGLGFAARARARDFAAILRDVDAHGAAACLARCAPDDLFALAEAAHFGGREPLARQAYAALRTRATGTDAARDATFLLGRSLEQAGDATAALELYDRYLADPGSGRFVGSALGGRMLILDARGRRAEARALAQRYLDRFATGPYGPQARAIVAAP